ncbi:MAG TPA: DUF6036 family nucleotidyltransferase [Cyclobacteriaceae bacterium]
MLTDLLKEIVTALEQEGIPYMISGSVAMNCYTIPRMTRDIDIVIELDKHSLASFMSIFGSNFYIHKPTIDEEIERTGMFNVIDHRSGYKIDFVVRKNTVYRFLEFKRRVRIEVMGFSAWLVTAEDLIISKLIWIQDVQSEKQMNDIKNLLESGDLDIVYIVSWIEQLNLKTFDLLPK